MKRHLLTATTIVAISGGLYLLFTTTVQAASHQRFLTGILSIFGGLSATGILQLVIGGVLADIISKLIPIRKGSNSESGEQSVNAGGTGDAQVQQNQNQNDGQEQDIDLSIDEGNVQVSQAQGDHTTTNPTAESQGGGENE